LQRLRDNSYPTLDQVDGNGLIRAVIFDYGGTLVQPRVPWESARPRAVSASYASLARAGLRMPLEQFVAFNESFFGEYSELEAKEDRDVPDIDKYYELVGRLFPARPEAWRRRVAARTNGAFWRVVVDNYVPKKGARRSLSELKSMGLKMAVVSNHHNHQALVEHLDRLGMGGYFIRVLSSDQLGIRKPDRRIFEDCLSLLGVEPAEAVFVGDSIVNDVGGAKGSGIKSILIDDESVKDAVRPRGDGRRTGLESGPPQADFEVSELDEIPRIVRRLNSNRLPRREP
jgi:HAD superfamily hydrolase (TIGR01549 family)